MAVNGPPRHHAGVGNPNATGAINRVPTVRTQWHAISGRGPTVGPDAIAKNRHPGFHPVVGKCDVFGLGSAMCGTAVVVVKIAVKDVGACIVLGLSANLERHRLAADEDGISA